MKEKSCAEDASQRRKVFIPQYQNASIRIPIDRVLVMTKWKFGVGESQNSTSNNKKHYKDNKNDSKTADSHEYRQILFTAEPN